MSTVHAPLQAAPLAHATAPAQAAGTPATHAPAPVHSLTVKTPARQVDPQPVPKPGYWHAPLALQSVAPHDDPVTHEAVQQRDPEPAGPHSPVAHWLLALHVPPGASFGTQAPLEQ